MQGGGYWHGQITHFAFKDWFNFELHALGTQVILNTRHKLPLSPRRAYRNTGWAESWDRAGVELGFCSACPRQTKPANKPQHVVRGTHQPAQHIQL